MNTTTTTTTMTITPNTGDFLIEKIAMLQAELRAYEFPKLTVEQVIDDQETHASLRCPRCKLMVSPDDLYAVDTAERWNSAYELDTDEAIQHGTVTFTTSGNSGEFGETLYYLHDRGGSQHAVSLPEDWAEEWV